jgi:hypothetical protein
MNFPGIILHFRMSYRYSFIFFFFTVFTPVSDYSQGPPPDSGSVSKFLTEKTWNELFPHRYNVETKDPLQQNHDFYSFSSFVKAASRFPLFLSEGDERIQKRELAAFLANISQETSGGWAEAPGGYFKWGLYFLEENPDTSASNSYTDTTKKNYPAFPAVHYYGRGPIQLSWNYNYGQFSETWFGKKETLLEDPTLLSKDPVLSFASAIWFWMTNQFPKPSCHDVMVGNWKPREADSVAGRLPGFGLVVNVINGMVECGHAVDMPKTSLRYEYYRFFCTYFKVDPGENISCGIQKPFGH